MLKPEKKKKIKEFAQKRETQKNKSFYEKVREGVIGYFEKERKVVLAKAAAGMKQPGYTPEHLHRIKVRDEEIKQIESVRSQLKAMDEADRKRKKR